MRRRLTKIKLGMISGPFLLLIAAVGLAWASGDDLYTLIRLLDKVVVTVSDQYVDPLDNEKLIDAGIEGMMAKLDPYSRYLEDNDYYYLLQETQGEYGGIGIDLEKTGDSLWVSSIIANSPAMSANIKIGDRLLYVDSAEVIGKSIADCRKVLRGSNGTTAHLRLLRPLLGQAIELEVSREEIHVDPIPCWFIDRYKNGYIKISRFSEGCAYELKSIISILKDKNISGLIIDLRDNPGGLLYESVEVTASFLNQGDKIVETKSRGEATEQVYNAREDGIYNTGPMVVLINNQTASAAEIVAGAIQDNDRGLLIGSTSYGKGLVQQVLKFSDNAALKLTTAKYYTPSDRCIQKDRELSGLRARRSAGDDGVLFFTKSGRPVFGGGGIIPDIYVEPYADPPIINNIISLGYVDEFVARYSHKINIDEEFQINDAATNEFISFLQGTGYLFKSPVLREFEEFKSELENSPTQYNITGSIDEMQRSLKSVADEELLSLRPQLESLLYDYLIAYNLGEKSANELSRQYHDPELVKAGEVLQNPQTYSGLLVGY